MRSRYRDVAVVVFRISRTVGNYAGVKFVPGPWSVRFPRLGEEPGFFLAASVGPSLRSQAQQWHEELRATLAL